VSEDTVRLVNMDTTCQCAETLNSKGERLVPKHHNCAYTRKRTALVWPASILAERDCEMFVNGTTDPEEAAIAFNRTFTAAMDKLAKESGLL
jgi:hypothetical protein